MKFRKLQHILAAVFPVLMLASCNENDVQDGYGWLSVDVACDQAEDLVVRSGSVSDFVWSLVVKDRNGSVVAVYDDYTELMLNPLSLHIGKYTVEASSSPKGDAAFDAPSYSGKADISIKADRVNTAQITCRLSNVKVTATFSDRIKSLFKEYTLTVSNGSGSLVYSNIDKGEGVTIDKEGYFSATGKLEWSLYLVNSEGYVYANLSDIYDDVKPCQHYILSFDLQDSPSDGAAAISLTVNNQVNDKEYPLLLDFGAGNLPKVTANFDLQEGFSFPEGDNSPRVMNFQTPLGLSALRFRHSSQTLYDLGITSGVDYISCDDASRSALEAAGIVVSSANAGSTAFTVELTDMLASLPVGSYVLAVEAVDAGGSFVEPIVRANVLSAVDAVAVDADAWAAFATLRGKWFADEIPSGLSFQYRMSGTMAWTDIPASSVTADALSKSFTAVAKGLSPMTEYQFRAVSDKDKDTPIVSFKTDAASQIHNMNFDYWYKDGNAWYPNLDSSYQVWDSANGGTASLGLVPTTPEESDVVSGKAAKLQSGKTFGQFAAGNIYTGKFGKAVLSPSAGATLEWGTPFTCRPTALRGWYKYNPNTIDNADSNHSSLKGTSDICQIQVILTDWDAPFQINTATGTFVDFENDPGIIAYGCIESSNNDSAYKQFTMKLEYRDFSRIPKYAVIVAAASKYGDFFTGAVGSTLYLDEFEFIYDWID